MTISAKIVRRVFYPILEMLAGRPNAVRFARALTMEARRDGDGSNNIQNNGELMVQDVVLRNAPPGRNLVVFDVGANQGEWTEALLREATGLEVGVHVFEPASATFIALRKNLSASPRVVFVNSALSDCAGKAKFYVMGAGLGTNSLQADSAAASVEEVTLNSADLYCQSQGITQVDLMKIDAEGHDMAVLRGAQALLASQSIGVLQFEYNQRWIGSRHYLKDAFDLLLPLGYRLGKVTQEGIEFYLAWDFELESFREGNYLACTPEWAERFPQLEWWNQP